MVCPGKHQILKLSQIPYGKQQLIVIPDNFSFQHPQNPARQRFVQVIGQM